MRFLIVLWIVPLIDTFAIVYMHTLSSFFFLFLFLSIRLSVEQFFFFSPSLLLFAYCLLLAVRVLNARLMKFPKIYFASVQFVRLSWLRRAYSERSHLFVAAAAALLLTDCLSAGYDLSAGTQAWHHTDIYIPPRLRLVVIIKYIF